ncbi:hypothetical protein K488DRAFT_89541 [Vararia minispora EC-137]|uniref:Uncharacterized protein n=1 Tax=Vararia minispora EC-137 TaxID=1314806 RepID=A0ACB8QAK8_9AGAM|nr:hypothetical protein K488DRAFT_89541 [Vararia minispora EC-137]
MDGGDIPSYKQSPSPCTSPPSLLPEPDTELLKTSFSTNELPALANDSSQSIAARFSLHAAIIIAVVSLILAAAFISRSYSPCQWHSQGGRIPEPRRIVKKKSDLYKEAAFLAQYTIQFMLGEELVEEEAVKSLLCDVDDILRSLRDYESLNWKELDDATEMLLTHVVDLTRIGIKEQRARVDRRIEGMEQLADLFSRFMHIKLQRMESVDADEASN